VVKAGKAKEPTATVLEAVEREVAAPFPTATLSQPVVITLAAPQPTAVLNAPEVKVEREEDPTPVLAFPVADPQAAFDPRNVLSLPVFPAPAHTPTKVPAEPEPPTLQPRAVKVEVKQPGTAPTQVGVAERKAPHFRPVVQVESAIRI
jgi:hypothetical protein